MSIELAVKAFYAQTQLPQFQLELRTRIIISITDDIFPYTYTVQFSPALGGVTFLRFETRASLPVTKFSRVVRWEQGKISFYLVPDLVPDRVPIPYKIETSRLLDSLL